MDSVGHCVSDVNTGGASGHEVLEDRISKNERDISGVRPRSIGSCHDGGNLGVDFTILFSTPFPAKVHLVVFFDGHGCLGMFEPYYWHFVLE